VVVPGATEDDILDGFPPPRRTNREGYAKQTHSGQSATSLSLRAVSGAVGDANWRIIQGLPTVTRAGPSSQLGVH